MKSEATKKTSISTFLNQSYGLSLAPVSKSLYDLYDAARDHYLEIKAYGARTRPVLDLKKIAQSVGQPIEISFFEYDKKSGRCSAIYIFRNPENLWKYLKATNALVGYSTTHEPQEFLDMIAARPKLQLHAHMCVHLYKTHHLYPNLIDVIQFV